MIDYAALLKQLTTGSDDERDSARQTLYALDEEAVEPLIDQFYAGVNEATGLAILEIVSDIGGWEARMLLEDVVHLSARYPHESWRVAARLGLQQYI
jgi:lysophospholipase L1-like esterase